MTWSRQDAPQGSDLEAEMGVLRAGGGKCSSGGRGSETWNRLRVFVGRASVCHQDTAVSPRSLLNGVSHTLTPRKCKIMPLLNGPWLSKYS